MEFKEGFNPGQNNTYTEVNFGPNSQYLPNVTELTIINGETPDKKNDVKGQNQRSTTLGKVKDEGQNDFPKSPFNQMDEPDPNKDLTIVKMAILNYVSRIAPKLKPEWMQGWEKFWKGLLDIDVIENEICKISKQKGTTFNRMLVCKIIRYLDEKKFYKDPYHPSEMARALEGDDQHTIRTHGLNLLPDEITCKRISNYIEIYNL